MYSFLHSPKASSGNRTHAEQFCRLPPYPLGYTCKGFGNWDFIFRIYLLNPKYEILNRNNGKCGTRTRKSFRSVVFKTTALPIRLTSQMTGTFGFEPKITVLETVGFPINSMFLKSKRRESNPQHLVWKTSTQPFEFRLQNNPKSKITNPKSECVEKDLNLQNSFE